MIRDIRWIQATPDSNIHASEDSKNRVRVESLDEFVAEFKEWRRKFPDGLKLITLTKYTGLSTLSNLRFWFGEPHSIKEREVDSMGHNLIASVFGTDLYDLRELVRTILGLTSILEGHEMVNEVECWRVK